VSFWVSKGAVFPVKLDILSDYNIEYLFFTFVLDKQNLIAVEPVRGPIHHSSRRGVMRR
jgi:hypothetical protein